VVSQVVSRVVSAVWEVCSVANKVMTGCLGVSIAINSWGAIKASQVPWPGTLIRIGIAFGIIGVVANWQEDLADMLAAGFLLASLVNLATTQGTSGPWTQMFGAVPPATGANFPFYTLGWGAIAAPGAAGGGAPAVPSTGAKGGATIPKTGG
jgi:hypothetical protein